MLAQAFPDDIEPAGERGVAEGAVALSRGGRVYGGDQGFLRVGEFSLRLCERCGDGADGFTGPVHGLSPRAENVQGSMNLASNTAPPGSTRPSSVAAIHLMIGCWIRFWMLLTARPVLRSYHCRLRS